MSSSNEFIKQSGRFDEIIQAIQKRVFEIGGVKMRIRVLSVHPSESSGESTDEVTLRLDLRPADNTSELLIVQESSFEARLSELALTYPFKLGGKIDKHVDALVEAIKKDAPQVLSRSPAPKVVFIEAVSYRTKIFAAAVSLLVAIGIAVLWRPLTGTAWWEKFVEGAQAVILVSVAGAIYKLLTARVKLK
jgi:hypothetical protein